MVKVTVATVALNAADDLPLTLESVLAQDHDDLELLVVDGASWDDTPGVLTRYGDAIDRVEVVEDGGIYVAMNHAASVASGEFVLFMNAGDRFHTERSLSKLLARTRPDADVVWGNHVWRDGAVEVFRIAMDPGTLLGELRIGAVGPRWIARFPAHQATLTRTALLRSLRYDTVWRLAADHDLLLRALHGGAVGQYVDEVVAIYASGGLSHHRAALCRLEWNAIYRAFSERPKAVDAAFYPHGSPFAGTPSPLAGGVVGGLVVEPGATAPPAEAWVGAAGLTLRTPTHALAREVRLHGRNDAPGQHLDLAAGGRSLGDAALAQGPFDLVVEFDPPLGPGTLLEAVPREVMRHPDRAEIVAFVLSGVAFASGGAPAPLPLRVPRMFSSDAPEAVATHLSRGWWLPEPHHVWTRGPCAELLLASEAQARHLTLQVRANPAVPGQTMAVRINSEWAGEHAAGGGDVCPVVVPLVGSAWRSGGATNRITLHPSASSRVGADERNLGVALVSTELS